MLKIIIRSFVLFGLANSFVICQQNTVGLIFNDSTQSYNGYTLFAPQLSKSTYLIDNEGRLVNKWESDYPSRLSAYLLEDGHLLRSAALEHPSDSTNSLLGGFQKFDWNDSLVWEYYYGGQHHDIEPLPNGNVLMVVEDFKDTNESILAGRDSELIGGSGISSVSIMEVEKTGTEYDTIVWQWKAWDHLVQELDSTKANFGVVVDHPELIDINFTSNGAQDWLHSNSISYNKDLDQIIISNRDINEIWIIDHSTTTEEAASHEDGNSGQGGDLLYRWGNPFSYGIDSVDDQKLFGQHDAHWIKPGLPGAGNILIFNNGLNSDRGFSSIEEIELPNITNGVYSLVDGFAYEPLMQSWIYTSNPPSNFNSPKYGGSQRLPNGNTLICNSNSGEFFEVTSEKEIVWKYINPVVGDSIIPQGSTDIDKNHVYRCYKYGPDYPGLPANLASGDPLGVLDDLNDLRQFELFNNYPNPFNPITNIEFSLTEQARIKLTIYDIIGNTIKTLINKTMEPGLNGVIWDSRDESGNFVGNGIYFYCLQVGQQNQTKKMVLLK